MLYLAKCADTGGINIHPRANTVAAVLRISLRTVKYALAGLRRKGYIKVVWESPGFVPHYAFILEKLSLVPEQPSQEVPMPPKSKLHRTHLERLTPGPVKEHSPSQEDVRVAQMEHIRARLAEWEEKRATYHARANQNGVHVADLRIRALRKDLASLEEQQLPSEVMI